MGEIINLNQYRKALRNLENQRKSVENRVKFGRLKSEKKASNRDKTRNIHALDMAKIEHIPVPLLTDKTPETASTPPHQPDNPGKGT